MASQATEQQIYTNYRVLGVNKKWDEQELQSFLGSHGNDIKPEVLSLALEPDRRTKTATVVFQNNKVPSSPIRPQKIVIEKTFHGITPLFTPPKESHLIDVIAVSGLNGHAFGSFKERNGDHMWLRDSLPEDLLWGEDEEDEQPMARILIYGYDSPLHGSPSFQGVDAIASSFRIALEDCKLSKPIIFIAHSLGGILIKQLLIHWSTSKNEKHQKLLQAVRGIVFFAVPHNGMDISSLIPMAENVNRGLLETLSRNNPEFLVTQRRDFIKAIGQEADTEVFCFYETRQSPTAQEDNNIPGKWKMDGPLAVLVDQPSATICRPWEDGSMHSAAIDRSHSEIIKFRPYDPEYKKVRGKLSDICERALKRNEKQKAQSAQVSMDVLGRRKRLMESLRFSQIDERLASVRHPYAKTYTWIMDHPTFRQWQHSTYIAQEHRMIWIKGNPGTGKSTLMKYAYNRILESAGKTTFVTSFFFNARGVDLERTVLGMYRSLLWQLLRQFPDLQAVFDNDLLLGRNRETCSVVELQDLLRAAVRSLGDRSIIWFIDALDECEQKEVAEMVYYFEELVADALVKHISLGICFSSRYYPEIRIHQALEFSLRDNRDHEKDLESYIMGRLHVDNTELVEKVLQKAAGVFLWAVLVVEILNKEDMGGAFAMNSRLEEVPDNLRDLFREILGQPTGNQIKDETTKLSMLWLLFAETPLKPVQYWNAVWAGLSLKGLLKADESPLGTTAEGAQDRAEKYVISSSKGLAQVIQTQYQTRVQLIHESIRDFLLKERGLGELWPELTAKRLTTLTTKELTANIVGLSHATLQHSCLEYWNYWAEARIYWYASSCDGQFLNYVVDFVLHHAEAASDLCSQDDFISNFPLSNYISTERSSQFNLNARNEDFLYVLSYHGYAKLITVFLQLEDIGHRTAERTGRHRFPTLVAAANGHQEALNVLLSSQAQICIGADLFDGLQLDINRDIQTVGEYDNYTPLSWAASQIYTQIASILVLKYQQPINERNKQGTTPLLEAAMWGREEIVRLLIENRADINAGNPLLEASHNGYEEIVRLLIENGADINAGNPLLEASHNGYEEIVRLLIENGADINADNPLEAASNNGHEEIVRLLIENGADINADNPLEAASNNGHEEIVRLLIENGADINAGNPLHGALIRGHDTIARLLIEKGADINTTDALDRTAVAHASRAGNTIMIELILEQDKAEIGQADYYGNTSLDAAVRNRHYDVVDLLLRNGARLSGMTNFADASLLGWARLGCENDDENAILQLLKSHTSSTDSGTRDDPAPAGYNTVQFRARRKWCDACTITISANKSYYGCHLCVGGVFAMCSICWGRGIRCLEDSHTLEKEIGQFIAN